MTTIKNESFWLSQKLMYHQDPLSGAALDLTLDSGVSIDPNWGPKYNPMRINFTIFDSRNTSNGRVKIDLHYCDLTKLCKNIKTMMQSADLATLANNQSRVVIDRFYHNNKKSMIIYVNNTPNGFRICMKVTDPTMQIQEGVIHFQQFEFITLINLVNSISTDYVSISTSYVNALTSERIINAMEKLSDKVDSNSEDVKDSLRNITNKITVMNDRPIQSMQYNDPGIEQHTEFNESVYLEEEPETISPTPNQDESQDDFNAMFSDSEAFNQFDIGKVEPSTKPVVTKTMVPSPFIGNLLNNDMKQLHAWIAGVVNGLNPFDGVMDTSTISTQEQQVIKSNPQYVDIQNLIMMHTKKSIRDYMLNNSAEYPPILPPISFGKLISKESTPQLYAMVIDMIVTLLSFNTIRISAIQYMTGNTNQSELLSEFQRTYFVYKAIIFPFIYSMNIDNCSEFEEDILGVFNRIKNNKCIDAIIYDYSVMTMGGQLDISSKMFCASLKSFLNLIQNNPSLTFEEVNGQFLEAIKEESASLEKCAPGSPMDILEEETISENVVIPEVDNIQLPTETAPLEREQINTVDRIELFKSLVKDEDDQLSSISTYVDLTEEFTKSTFPDSFYITKRVMDINEDITDKFKMKKLIKEFEEDPNVTQARVMQPSESAKSEELPDTIFDEF